MLYVNLEARIRVKFAADVRNVNCVPQSEFTTLCPSVAHDQTALQCVDNITSYLFPSQGSSEMFPQLSSQFDEKGRKLKQLP